MSKLKLVIGLNGSGKTKYFEDKYFNSKRLSQFNIEINDNAMYVPAGALLKKLESEENVLFSSLIKENKDNVDMVTSQLALIVGAHETNKKPQVNDFENWPSDWYENQDYVSRFINGITNHHNLNNYSYNKIQTTYRNFLSVNIKAWANKNIAPEEMFLKYIKNQLFSISASMTEVDEFFMSKVIAKLDIEDDLNKFNEILKRFKLNTKYMCEIKSESISRSIKVGLHDNNDNIINYDFLSTGEKTLLNIASAIFISNVSNQNNIDTLILDEPDAFLNAASIDELITNLKNIDLKTFIITHNPITVEVYKDNVLFIENQAKPKEISNRLAINKLLADSETINVRKVDDILVFCEAKNDARFYYKHNINSNTLSFSPVSTNNEKGGITEIDNIKKAFDKINIKTVRFIKDCDGEDASACTNKADSNVVVNPDRRELENYWFDPVQVAITMRNNPEDFVEKVSEIFGRDELIEKTYSIDGKTKTFNLPKSFLFSKLKGKNMTKPAKEWVDYLKEIQYDLNINKLIQSKVLFKEVVDMIDDIIK